MTSKIHRIAVTSPSFSKQPDLLKELEALGVPVVANVKLLDLEGKSLSEFLNAAKATAAIIGREVMSESVVAATPDLRCVAKYGVGLDNIDQAALKARGIRFYDAPGTNKRAVAELVLAFALGHSRNVIPSLLNMKDGRWAKHGGRDLSALTFGIVGFGHTGAEVAKLLKAFGTKVFCTDILDKSAEAAALGATTASFENILAQCDIISFHVPATPETRLMFGTKELKKVQPHALVINTSRGAVVDFDETVAAVMDGRLGGFAADVYPIEPYDVSTRLHPRLYFTPHIGGNSREAVMAMGRAAIKSIADFLKSP